MGKTNDASRIRPDNYTLLFCHSAFGGMTKQERRPCNEETLPLGRVTKQKITKELKADSLPGNGL